MDPINLTTKEYVIYAALIGAGIGALFGLVPLILGLRRDSRKLGLYGFVASIIGGAFAPVLSVVIVAVFVWLILRKRSSSPASDEEPPTSL